MEQKKDWLVKFYDDMGNILEEFSLFDLTKEEAQDHIQEKIKNDLDIEDFTLQEKN